ncbi:MAG: 2-oxoacid:acceptor oxidoreductase subunit alpha [Candidatus Lokiarchaeota archaeon]|nr:2-oxoacid:acceptor oxidoreductase subunit alpha [Candidatus Lokiarchaeota archaeon]
MMMNEELIVNDYDLEPGKRILMGNIAMAEGAIAAGCRLFAGYPITPQNEVPQHLSKRLPQVGGRFIQMEDEIGSISAVLGASMAGIKAMTSTSGCGFSLMQESISMAANNEIPCVICDVQRGGPGSGIVSLPHQSDVMQAHFGGNGEYILPTYAPSTCQDLFDFMMDAFNSAETYRVPVIMLSDAFLGHNHEQVIIPTAEELNKKIVPRRRVLLNDEGETLDPQRYRPFTYEDSDSEGGYKIPQPPILGTEYHPNWMPTVTHTADSIASEDAIVAKKVNIKLTEKITNNADKICKNDKHHLDDSDIAVLCYGLPYRTALKAMRDAREENIKVGIFRMRVVWPLPRKEIKALGETVKTILVPEINLGQILEYVNAIVKCDAEVIPVTEIGGLHKPEQILNSIKEANK